METDAYDDDVPVCSELRGRAKTTPDLRCTKTTLRQFVRRLARTIGMFARPRFAGKRDYLKRRGFAGQPL